MVCSHMPTSDHWASFMNLGKWHSSSTGAPKDRRFEVVKSARAALSARSICMAPYMAAPTACRRARYLGSLPGADQSYSCGSSGLAARSVSCSAFRAGPARTTASQGW